MFVRFVPSSASLLLLCRLKAHDFIALLFFEWLTCRQGRLGDCWFLSAVAVLTEASRISEVIITPEYNDEGIYTVRFCIQVLPTAS